MCAYCQVTDLFIAYEPRIFGSVTITAGNVTTDADDGSGNLDSGEFKYLKPRGYKTPNQGPSEFEIILRAMKHLGHDSLREKFERMLELIELMKKEFFQARVLSLQLWDRVSVFDEMSMCTLRLRLRLPGMYIPALEEPLYVDNLDVENARLVSQFKQYE